MGEFLKGGAASLELVLEETCNAVLVCRRRGLIGGREFNRCLDSVILIAETSIKLFPQVPLIRGAMDIAIQSGLTMYDSAYLALAKQLDSPLLSVDSRQLREARKLGLRVVDPHAH